MKTVLLTNAFHNTEIRVPSAGLADLVRLYREEMTPAQRQRVRRIHDRLCGSPDCACGDALGCRPALDLDA